MIGIGIQRMIQNLVVIKVIYYVFVCQRIRCNGLIMTFKSSIRLCSNQEAAEEMLP